MNFQEATYAAMSILTRQHAPKKGVTSEILEVPKPGGGTWHVVRTWEGRGTGFVSLKGEVYTEGGYREAQRVAKQERDRVKRETA